MSDSQEAALSSLPLASQQSQDESWVNVELQQEAGNMREQRAVQEETETYRSENKENICDDKDEKINTDNQYQEQISSQDSETTVAQLPPSFQNAEIKKFSKAIIGTPPPMIGSGSQQEAANTSSTNNNNNNINNSSNNNINNNLNIDDDESSYNAGQFFWKFANFGISFLQFFMIIGVIFFSVGYYFWNQEIHVQKPMIALQEFADLQEKRQGLRLDQSQLESLPVEQMHFFASAACVHGDFQQVSVALEKQLKSAPRQVREDILDQALIEGVSVQNSRQDATVDVENKGKAHAYLAFYSTQHIPSALAEPQYSSCVMVAGMEFSVAEELASWEIQTDYKNLGYQDCDCGLFSCRKCPIIKEITTKRPVFKRHQLTFLDHKKLHQEMQRLAVQKAKDLTSGINVGGPWWQLVPMVGSSLPTIDQKNKADDSTWDFREDPFTAP